MHSTLTIAAVYFGLAFMAGVLGLRLGITTALVEVSLGVLAQFAAVTWLGSGLGVDETWVKVLATMGAMLLTFMAGAEVSPEILRRKWRESLAIGGLSFLGPFLFCTALAYYLLGWTLSASWLCGVALSGTSVAVIYTVTLEHGLNKTELGKTLLAACFITDLLTVSALGLIFTGFSYRVFIFLAAGFFILLALPALTGFIIRRYGETAAELEIKFLVLILATLGALAVWAGSEAVLPAYLVGIVLAGRLGREERLVRRLRAVSFGFLTPFFFIRAGALVFIPALISAPVLLLVLLIGKVLSKSVAVYPTTLACRYSPREGAFATLLMSTGLAFGTIASIFGLGHNIITQLQYSLLIGAIVASAIIPTLVAVKFFLPMSPATAVQADPITLPENVSCPAGSSNGGTS